MTILENRLVSKILPMIKPIKKYWMHFVIWVIVIFYLIYSPILYYQLLVQDGKPIEVIQQTPIETGMIRYHIENLRFRLKEMVFYEEGVYELWGWSFINLEDKTKQMDYERFIVLNSPIRISVFSMEPFWRPDVQDAFQELNMDLKSSGFYAVISKNALPQGLSCIGILYKDIHTGDTYYSNTMRGLVRTPNEVRLEETRLDECKYLQLK